MKETNYVKRTMEIFNTKEFLCESKNKTVVNISPYHNGEWICGFNLITTWQEVFGAKPAHLYWRTGDEIAEKKIKNYFNKILDNNKKDNK